MNLSIIRAGYVGLVTGACFAKLGHQVICVDLDERKLDMINRGHSPLYEAGLEELLSAYRDRIEATTDYDYALNTSDVTFICVGTPAQRDGSIDLSQVQEHKGTPIDVGTIADLEKANAFYSRL